MPFVQRALVTHESDPARRHLAAIIGEASPGAAWQGRTSCGLTGALTFVGAARHALLPGVTEVCPSCLSHEAAAQREQGAG
ncbi:MAG TPA: hypothetical protein VM287_03645 [Egibacteraceae bacterium]|nr:hypothetical protein [Egibacteraceae bacterium]